MRSGAGAALVLCVALGATACFAPQIGDGQYACGPGGACPAGFRCEAGVCRSGTGGLLPDAGPSDPFDAVRPDDVAPRDDGVAEDVPRDSDPADLARDLASDGPGGFDVIGVDTGGEDGPGTADGSGTGDAGDAGFDGPQVPVNLTTNASFETDTSGWSGYNAALSRTNLVPVPDGAYAAVVTCTDTSDGYFTIDDSPATVRDYDPGLTYTASAFVRAVAPSSVGKSVQIIIRERDASGRQRQLAASDEVPLSLSFQKISVSYTPSPEGGSLDTYVVQDDAAFGDAFLVDLYLLHASP